MKMLTHISIIVLLSVGGAIAQGQAPVEYDPHTGEPIESTTPLAAAEVSTTHIDRPSTAPIDYDPLTGLPSRYPKNTSSTKLTSGSRVPAIRNCSYQLIVRRIEK